MHKKYLIITNLALGDFIWATSAIALLKKNFPDSANTVILTKTFEDYARNNPVIDKYICYDALYDGKVDLKFRIKQIRWLIKNFFKLLRGKYDACIFLDSSPFFIAVAKLIGIKTLVGADIKTLRL